MIALDLGWNDAFAEFRMETFVRCWEQGAQHGWGELSLDGSCISPGQMSALTRELTSSASLLEDILGCYFEELASGGELQSRGVDATAWALAISEHLTSGQRLWKTRVELYRHTWKVKRFYDDTSAVSISPIFHFFDRTTPDWTSLTKIYEAFSRIESNYQIDIPAWMSLNCISQSVANVRFINFLLYNDVRFVSSSETPFFYHRIDAIIDNFDSAALHYDFTGCVEAEGLSLRDGIRPEAVNVKILSHSILEQLRPDGAIRLIDHDEVTIKAFMRSREASQLVQGIPASTYQLIIDTISSLGRIVSLRDVKRITGASRLRFDPFLLNPGPLVVYAPGDRYLHGDSVSFALRDWIQDDEHKKGRVTADRILTPLFPCEIASSQMVREICLTSSAEFRRAGVVFRRDASKRLQPKTDKQGQRWAAERTMRAIDSTLTMSGLVKAGDAFFDKAVWDLRDAKGMTTFEIRKRILRAISAGHVPSAVNASADLKERILSATEL